MTQEVVRELLPVLIVLYPVLLLLEDLEPGFVRSVVNPHAFLLALLAAATLTPRAERHAPFSRRAVAMVAAVGAVVTAGWVWWRLDAGILGAVVAVLAAVAVGAAVASTVTGEAPHELVGIPRQPDAHRTSSA